MIVPENARLEDIGQWGRARGWGTPFPTRAAYAYGRPAHARPVRPHPQAPVTPLAPAISSKRRRKLARRAAAAAEVQQEAAEADSEEMEGIF